MNSEKKIDRHNNAGGSTKGGPKTNKNAGGVDRARLLEERRLRNIESAKRSRARIDKESKWIETQMKENEDRIISLEKTIGGLEKQLASPPPPPPPPPHNKRSKSPPRRSHHISQHQRRQEHPQHNQKSKSSSVRHSIHFGGKDLPSMEKRPEWFGDPY